MDPSKPMNPRQMQQMQQQMAKMIDPRMLQQMGTGPFSFFRQMPFFSPVSYQMPFLGSVSAPPVSSTWITPVDLLSTIC